MEGFTAKIFNKLKKAAPRFELGIKDLQSSALPLGHAAVNEFNQSITNLNSKTIQSLLIICNGHGEDIIALEIIKRMSVIRKSLKIEVLPLVGNGYIFDSIKGGNVNLVGNLKVLPSGGFSNQSFKGLVLDFCAGMPLYLLKNWLFVLKKSNKGFRILAIGDLLPLFFAWTSRCQFAFIGTPKSDHTWTSGPGWNISDFYHKFKGSEWDPWEINLMRHSNCKTVIVRDEITANNLMKKRVNASFLGNPMMDFVESNLEKNYVLDDYMKVILLIGSRYPEAFNNLTNFLSCLNPFNPEKKVLILFPLSRNSELDQIEAILMKYDYKLDNFELLIGEESIWRKNNQFIVVGLGTFNNWANLAEVGLSNAGTATEQISGLGIPSLSIPGVGPQFTKSFAQRQQRLLGGAVNVCDREEDVLKRLNKLLNNKSLRKEQSKLGVKRMGPKGGSERIVNHLNLKLLFE